MVWHPAHYRRGHMVIVAWLLATDCTNGRNHGGQKRRKEPRPQRLRPVQRRLIDAEITKRSVAFIEHQAKTGKPFFAYVALTQPHLPWLPNPAFAGKTGNGDWADMLTEMDYNVGQVLDAVDRLGIRD